MNTDCRLETEEPDLESPMVVSAGSIRTEAVGCIALICTSRAGRRLSAVEQLHVRCTALDNDRSINRTPEITTMEDTAQNRKRISK